MIRAPSHDEPCVIPRMLMSETETVIASASVTVTVIGTVTAVNENEIVIVTTVIEENANANVSVSVNAAEMTKTPRAVVVDERNVHAKMTENEAVEVTLSPHEKCFVGRAAAKLVVGSVANETTLVI